MEGNSVSIYQRSFKITCSHCGWYVILRRNGGMISMFINNFNNCPKCGGSDLKTTTPTFAETINPWEQFRKYYYKFKSK